MPDADVSNINLIGLLFTLVMGFLTLVLPRRIAILPLIVTSCYITIGQQAVIGGFHFSVLRIMILFGWFRLFVRRELISMKFNTIDKLIIIYTCASVIIYVLLWGTYDAFKNQLGFAYNVIGVYFLFRYLVRGFQDIERTIKILGLVLIPLAGFMILEKLTGRNIFSIFGGVSEVTQVRDGILRAQGSFRHPILAGTFGATSMPLLVGLWAALKNHKLWLKLGIVSSTLITIMSASSGPAMAYIFGLIGLLSWILRRHMRLIVWGLVASLLFLHMVMKAPVWFLMARVNIFSSSTGWYRAYLIDQAIRHLNEWWLIGTKHTADWMPYALSIDPTMADITNQFIAEGVSGGLLKLFLFISIIVVCFRTIGQRVRIPKNTDNFLPFQVWAIGVCLLVHVVSFSSISYFDQMVVFWYMLLAFIAGFQSENRPTHPILKGER
jgi:hypothetical protein